MSDTSNEEGLSTTGDVPLDFNDYVLVKTSARGAAYCIVPQETNEDRITIRDIGNHERQRTITNDAEGVVRSLHLQSQLNAGRRLYYYDSENQKAELRHNEGRFVGFAFD